MLGAILFVFGAVNGAMDVSMNAHGVAVERELPQPIMSSLHGGWSVGGFVACGPRRGRRPRRGSTRAWRACSSASRSGWRALDHLAAGDRVGPLRGGQRVRAAVARRAPDRRLCFLVMMTEGAIGDWSGIYLRHDAGASAAAAATGFTGFSLGMAVARLGGDVLNERLGAGALLRGGMALVAIALGGVLLIGAAVPAVIGFALCGLGIANAVPLLFSAAGRLDPPGPRWRPRSPSATRASSSARR